MSSKRYGLKAGAGGTRSLRDARYIHYQSRNKEADLSSQDSPRGRDVYGYTSSPDRLIDDSFACGWTIRRGLRAAKAEDRELFPQSFASLQVCLPRLRTSEVPADAALGLRCCLDPIREAGALRLVDIGAAAADDHPQVQLRREYNDKRCPLCIWGYEMRSNGHDYRRRRIRWCCEKASLRDQKGSGPDCSYLAPEHKHGQVINVGQTLPDGPVQLVQEVPSAPPCLEEALWPAQPFGEPRCCHGRDGPQAPAQPSALRASARRLRSQSKPSSFSKNLQVHKSLVIRSGNARAACPWSPASKTASAGRYWIASTSARGATGRMRQTDRGPSGAAIGVIQERVESARELQRARFEGTTLACNVDMGPAEATERQSKKGTRED